MSPTVRPKPIIHGRDHMPGGADPIPGITGAPGDFETVVLSIPNLLGYWRLGEASGPWRDTSGVAPAADLAETGTGTALAPNVAGALTVGDDGALEFNYDGTSLAGGRYLEGGGGSGKNFDLAGAGEMTVAAWVKVKASAGTRRGVVVGTSNIGVAGQKQGWGLQVLYPSQKVRFTRGDVSGVEKYAETPGGVDANEWNLFVGTYDGTTIQLYANGALVATAADPTHGPSSLGGKIRVGFGYADYITFSGVPSFLYGTVDEAAVWTRALTPTEIANLYTGGTTGLLPPPEGGGIELPPVPSGDPIPGGGGWTGPTDPGGYHYSAHYETAVLYSSVPGRFDVPSRKWTRAPFDTVRIFRSWQPSAGGVNQWAFLPDDRGLTAAAENGVLLVTDAMTYGSADMTLRGYVVPEYPILDFEGLPDYTAPPPGIIAPDPYARAIRFRNATTGHVLRDDGFDDGNWRPFLEWLFLNPASGNPIVMAYREDNPYPVYLSWPARPLHKPLPYPTLGVAETKAYYEDSVHNGGWSNINALEFIQRWPAGTKIVLETWQDSPWPLRFSTNTYPHYALNIHPDHENRPYLGITYRYDPATIDHATGLLL